MFQEERFRFIFASILDAQSTIRAIDVKVAALFIILFAPLQNINRVIYYLDHYAAQSPIFHYIAFLFILLWGLSFIALVRAISAIQNPIIHIKKKAICDSTFYGGWLYKLSILDIFFDRKSVISINSLEEFITKQPSDEVQLEKELSYEQMKLFYIRDMKLLRLKWSIYFSLAWSCIGLYIYIYSKYYIPS